MIKRALVNESVDKEVKIEADNQSSWKWIQRIQCWTQSTFSWKSKNSFESFEASTEANYQVETLEPRMMLNGDGSTDISEEQVATMFDLPAEVGQSLINILQDSASYGSGPWQSDTPTISSSSDWAGASSISSPGGNSWRDYLIDDTAATGVTNDSTLDSMELEGGGHLVFLLDSTQDRTVENPTAGGGAGSGGASAGGTSEGNTIGSVKKESVDSTTTTTIVWADDQAEVDAINAAGSIDTTNFGSYFQVTVTNDFVYDDRELSGSEIRSYSVTNNYTITVNFVWTGSNEVTDLDADGGTIVTTANYNTNGTLLFTGTHLYEGTVSADANGNFIEAYSQIGSGSADIYLNSQNVVTSVFSEGDLVNTGFGTIATVTVADDYLMTSDNSFNYTGDGNRNTSNDDGDTEYHLLSTSNYNLLSSPEVTSSYESVLDQTVETNQDIIDAANEEAATDGSGETPEVVTLDSAIYSASGSFESNSYLTGHGYQVLAFDEIELYGGNTTTTVNNDRFDYWDTTGSNVVRSDQFQFEATSLGNYYSESGSSQLTIENDNIGTNQTDTYLVQTAVNFQPPEDADIEGFIDSQTNTTLARTRVESESEFDVRSVRSSLISADPETPGDMADSLAAVTYLNSYTPVGLDSAGAANNPATPDAVAGFNIIYSIAAGKTSNNYEENQVGPGDSNVKLEFLAGDATQTTLDGSSQTDYTQDGSFDLSIDNQSSSGDFAGENGNYVKDHFSLNNTNASHGSFGSTYDMTWAFDEGAVTESEPTTDPDTGEAIGPVSVVDPDKVTLTGSNSTNSSSMIDSDVTTTNEEYRSEGRYVDGNFDANDNPIDPTSEYSIEKWLDSSTFTEIENLTGSSSSSTTGNYTSAEQVDSVDADSNYASDISGSGSNHSEYLVKYSDHGGDFPGGGGEGLGTTYDTHSLFLHYVSDSNLVSTGADAVNVARDTTNKLVDNSVDPDGGTGDGGTGGSGGVGDPGGTADPPPSYDFDVDENKTVSNSGLTTLDSTSSYGISVNSPSYQMDFQESYTGISGHEEGLVSHFTESHLTASNNAPHSDLSFVDNTTQTEEWKEDGLYLVTNGSTSRTLVSSGDTVNHGVISDQKNYDDGNGTTRTLSHTVAPNDYHVTYQDTTTVTDTYEDFGQRVVYGQVDQSGDTVELVGGGIVATTNGVGKHTRSINSVGNETYDHDSKVRENKTTPFGGGHREDNLDVSRNGDWNLTDTVVGDFAVDGSHTLTSTPTGFRNWNSTIVTDGDHDYNFSQVDSEGYTIATHQFGNYSSNTVLGSNLNRSGEITASFDTDGNVVSASGSFVNNTISTGNASATDNATVDKTKSKTITVSGGGSGSGGGTPGGPGGPGTGPSVTSTKELTTAHRNRTQTNQDFFGTETESTWSASVDASGELAISDAVTTYLNDVSGTRTGSDSSFVKEEVTDHYDDGTSSTGTTYLQAPMSMDLGDSYGVETVNYAGFRTENFGAAGYQGQIIDTSFNGANLTFGAADGGFGTEEEEGYSLLLQSFGEGAGGDSVQGLEPPYQDPDYIRGFANRGAAVYDNPILGAYSGFAGATGVPEGMAMSRQAIQNYKELQGVVEFGVGVTPILGQIVTLREAVEGKDMWDNELTTGQRVFSGLLFVASAPGAPTGAFKSVKGVTKIGAQTIGRQAKPAASGLSKLFAGSKNATSAAAATANAAADASRPTLSQLVGMIKCFTGDTLVSTETGLRPIGEIGSGDQVYAMDFESGKKVLRPVVERIDNVYQGPVVTIRSGESEIRTTVYHPFWVASGQDLGERSVPRELSEGEDEDGLLSGRWVNSHELRVGDVVVNDQGKEMRVTQISQEWSDELPVSNLTVDQSHNYFVGADSILVHNTSVCDETISKYRKLIASKKLTPELAEEALLRAGHSADEIADAMKKIAPRKTVLIQGEDFGHLKTFVFEDSKGVKWDLGLDADLVDGRLIVKEAHIGPQGVKAADLDKFVGKLEMRNFVKAIAERHGVKRVDFPTRLDRSGTRARKAGGDIGRKADSFDFGEVYFTIDENGRVKLHRF